MVRNLDHFKEIEFIKDGDKYIRNPLFENTDILSPEELLEYQKNRLFLSNMNSRKTDSASLQTFTTE